MDTPTRERIEALELRVKELEAEVKLLRKTAGAVSEGKDFREIARSLPEPVPHDYDDPARLKAEGTPMPLRNYD